MSVELLELAAEVLGPLRYELVFVGGATASASFMDGVAGAMPMDATSAGRATVVATRVARIVAA